MMFATCNRCEVQFQGARYRIGGKVYCEPCGDVIANQSNRKGQNFASVATVRAAIESVIDRGWKCSTNCDVQHPWQFPTELFPGDDEPDDEALKHRQAFIDAVISEIGKSQSLECSKEQKAKGNG